MFAEGVADNPPVISDELRLTLAETLEKGCRALDGREGESHGAGGGGACRMSTIRLLLIRQLSSCSAGLGVWLERLDEERRVVRDGGCLRPDELPVAGALFEEVGEPAAVLDPVWADDDDEGRLETSGRLYCRTGGPGSA